MRIILASTSLRRKELLKTLNISFEIMTENIKEVLDENKNHYNECMNNARNKAKAVFDKIDGDVIVISSDTIVSKDGKIYGKPKNNDEAFKMIKELSGSHHEVISSICLYIRKNNKVYEELDYDKCRVFVSNMNNDEIDDWIKNNDVTSYAGAYAIQEGFGKYVEKVEGDYFSIVGLPLHKLYELIKKYI